ncbi:hypothetical protein TNCV_1870031, partial [Trichonephila clavipes]
NEERCFWKNEKTDLSTLYDELKRNYGRWRALTNTRKIWRFTPLVESCLPEEILMAWERKRNTETDAKGLRTLEHLMTFLRPEVHEDGAAGKIRFWNLLSERFSNWKGLADWN